MPISTSSHSATIAASIAMYPSRPCSALPPAAVLPPTGPSSVRPRSHPPNSASDHKISINLSQMDKPHPRDHLEPTLHRRLDPAAGTSLSPQHPSAYHDLILVDRPLNLDDALYNAREILD